MRFKDYRLGRHSTSTWSQRQVEKGTTVSMKTLRIHKENMHITDIMFLPFL